MASQQEISALTDAFIKVFGKNIPLIEASLEAIKVNTVEVTKQNEVAKLRKEIAAFVETKEAEIQALLGMK